MKLLLDNFLWECWKSNIDQR